jgi:Zn-dependent peptidase ImmA (M78 family)
MDMRTLRRRYAARIRDLPIPIPFDTEIFTSAIADRRGRPIVLQPMPLLGETFGAWIEESSVDVVFYEQHTTPLHQQHIILHELGHILCNHQGIEADELSASSLPDAGQSGKRLRALRDGRYTEEEEREAEMIATLILMQVTSAQANTTARDPDITGTLRLLDSLEGLIDGE